MKKTIVLSFISILAAVALANESWKPVQIEFNRDADAFVRSVGMMCLSTPKSRMEPSGHKLKVVDEPGCAQEIKKLAAEWDRSPETLAVITTHTGSKDKTEIRKNLSEKLGSDAVEFLAETQSCPCLVFKGPKAAEAVEIVRSFKKKN